MYSKNKNETIIYVLCICVRYSLAALYMCVWVVRVCRCDGVYVFVCVRVRSVKVSLSIHHYATKNIILS